MMQLRTSNVSRAVRLGVLADAACKLAVAAVYAAWIAPLSAWLAAPTWLIAVTAVLVAAAGVAELATDRARARIDVVYLAAYDAAWALATIAAALMGAARVDGAGAAWLAVQAVAAAILTVPLIVRSVTAGPSMPRPTRK